jgi:hypothetical protein
LVAASIANAAGQARRDLYRWDCTSLSVFESTGTGHGRGIQVPIQFSHCLLVCVAAAAGGLSMQAADADGAAGVAASSTASTVGDSVTSSVVKPGKWLSGVSDSVTHCGRGMPTSTSSVSTATTTTGGVPAMFQPGDLHGGVQRRPERWTRRGGWKRCGNLRRPGANRSQCPNGRIPL